MKNWHERIEEAKERGGFTGADMELSASWVTCACGEQDKRLMRGQNLSPWDDHLRMLGERFNNEVKNNEIDHAEITLEEIEERAYELLHPTEEYDDGRDFTPPYEP